MTISIDHLTREITIPQADLTFITGELYELDVNDLRLWLKDLEDDAEGINMPDTHRHNTQVTLGGVTLARTVEIINGYTITFEDGQYAVRLVGANNNLADVLNVNQVSVRSNNSAGLIVVATGEGGGTEPPTVQQIRAEMDANSSKLALIPGMDTNIDDIETAVGALGAPPTPAEIRQEIDTNSTRFTALDQAIAGLPVPPTPPTVVEIRQEMDANSVDLNAIQAAINALPAAPSVTAIRQEIDAHSTRLTALDQAVAGVPSATLGTTVETGLTFLGWLRLMAAAVIGEGEVPTQASGSFFFKSYNNAKNRLVGTVTDKVRQFTTKDSA